MNEPNPLPIIHTLICFAAHHSVAFVVITICFLCENDPEKKKGKILVKEKKKKELGVLEVILKRAS